MNNRKSFEEYAEMLKKQKKENDLILKKVVAKINHIDNVMVKICRK